ncbi:nucleotide sugar dehydrogenase [Candidatus Altiarchaeota archaeon]
MSEGEDVVSVVGLGKAGLPLVVVVAESGLKCIGVDVNQETVDKVNSGKAPFEGEPGLEEGLQKYKGDKIVATSDPVQGSKDSTVHIVIVPLFIDENKLPDFSIIKAAMEGVGKGLKKGDLVVLETTVPVGTTRNLVGPILEKESGLKAGQDFYLAYSPERIMTGYSISRFREFPKVVGGIDDASTERAFNVYRQFCKAAQSVSSCEVAELTKVSEGVFRDINIALANELYRVCDYYGVDFWEVREAAKHEYCNIYEPGVGVGGHCIPVYPHLIIQDLKKNEKTVPLMDTARRVNDDMAAFFRNKMLSELAKKKISAGGAKVCVIGLSFREGLKEDAYARSKPLINLLKQGGCKVYGADPWYSPEEIQKVYDAIPHEGKDFSDMDGIILTNKEKIYKDALLEVKDKVIVIDCKNTLRD